MTDNNSPSLVVVLNSNKELEYFRDQQLSKKQIDDLKKVETRLNQGFHLGGHLLEQPTAQDKATFMANMLVEALINNNESTMALCCSYLATRYESLKQIRATVHDDRCTIQLINDQAYVEEAVVQIFNKNDLS